MNSMTPKSTLKSTKVQADDIPPPRLMKVAGRPAWHIYYNKKRISTGTADDVEAKLALRDFIASLPDKEKAAARKRPTSTKFTTALELIDFWEAEMKHQNEPVWRKKWKSIANTLRRHTAGESLDDLDRYWSRDYAMARRAEGVSDTSVNDELRVVRAAMNRAMAMEHVDAKRVFFDIPKPGKPREVFLTKDEVQALLDAAKHAHLKLFIRLAIKTGGRSGAILDLTWDRCRLDGKTPFVDLMKDDGRRRKKAPKANLPISFAEELKAIRSTSTSGHVIEFAGKRVEDIGKSFATAVEKADLDPSVVTPYALRHTAATWLAQSGKSLWAIAGFLGHSSTAMVERVYGHHCPSHMRSTARELWTEEELAIEDDLK